MLTIADHILAFVLILAFPIYSWIEYRRLKRTRAALIAEGKRPDNVPEYRWTIAIQWSLSIAMLASWLRQSRSLLDLGIAMPPERALWNGWGFVVIAALTLVVIGMLAYQAITVRRSEKMRAAVREQIASVRDILPSTQRELKWFSGLSLTAGICEELLYRGWMIWYLSQAMSLWAAVPLSALIFGVAHVYQGPSGIAKTGPIGLVCAAMYIVSGSLWLPMLMHFTIDFFSGRMSFDALTMDDPAHATPHDASHSVSPVDAPAT